jgi:hypothetical protein
MDGGGWDRADELRSALKAALLYLETVKRNESHIREAFQAKGLDSGFLLASLDARIARIKATL